jgi:type IV pilus assembly protein PilE
MKRSTGFTLIELMVAIAIVAILAAIALPSYTRYVQRGDLVEATQALSQYRVQMEQWYQDNNTYANGAACGVAAPTTLVNFTVACALTGGANGQAYTATATANNPGPVAGFKYTIDQSNNQQTTGLPTNWSPGTTLPATSWIIR